MRIMKPRISGFEHFRTVLGVLKPANVILSWWLGNICVESHNWASLRDVKNHVYGSLWI